MSMTPSTRALLRQNLLLQLSASSPAGRIGLGVKTLHLGTMAGGYDAAENEIRGELAYLRDKGLAEPIERLVSPEVERWRITAAGRDWLALEGLQ